MQDMRKNVEHQYITEDSKTRIYLSVVREFNEKEYEEYSKKKKRAKIKKRIRFLKRSMVYIVPTAVSLIFFGYLSDMLCAIRGSAELGSEWIAICIGWKKIRRVRTRYELLYRANAQSDALVGKVDPDKNGKATIIGKIQGIINAMIKEKKLTAGTVTESTTYIADADNCYFDLDIIDKDSAEHIYSFYKFRFSTNAE